MPVTIRGVQEAQRANEHNIAQLRPNGAFGRLIQEVTIWVHRYAIMYTHVVSGALRASHRMDVKGLRAFIYPDPAAVNPKGGLPAQYGITEEARGGEHAFYYRAAYEAGPQIVNGHWDVLLRALK
jgi:hypothetical protein